MLIFLKGHYSLRPTFCRTLSYILLPFVLYALIGFITVLFNSLINFFEPSLFPTHNTTFSLKLPSLSKLLLHTHFLQSSTLKRSYTCFLQQLVVLVIHFHSLWNPFPLFLFQCYHSSLDPIYSPLISFDQKLSMKKVITNKLLLIISKNLACAYSDYIHIQCRQYLINNF